MILQRVITGIILVGSLTAFIVKRDIFPFSDYPMYSKVFSSPEPLTFYKVVGTTPAGDEKSFVFQQDLPPFWANSYREALLIEPNPEVVQRKLNATLKWYNTRHASSPLVGLKLYRYDLPWSEFSPEALTPDNIQELARRYRKLEVETTP